MNSTDYSNAIFNSIDIIVDKKLRELGFDKTIKCKVKADTSENALVSVEYQGITFFADRLDKIYKKDDIVYVLIPQNDMSNKKFIIGKK